MKNKIGIKGEEIAKQYLINKGYEIISGNFHTRAGEVDIIAKVAQAWVFVEVKTRTSLKYGTGAEAVTQDKMRKICNAAVEYIQKYDLFDCEIRFDVIEIHSDPSGLKIQHFENAFQFVH